MGKRDEIRKACEAATPGPWTVGHDDYGDEWWFGGDGQGEVVITRPGDRAMVYGGHDLSDAAFIAGAREWVPALLAENEELREALRELAESARLVARLADPPIDLWPRYLHADAVARALLGEDA